MGVRQAMPFKNMELHVRSLLYGAIVYESARTTTLKMLNPVHHLKLRLASGAFRTLPVLSLYPGTLKMSLEKRRQHLGLCYAFMIYSNPKHPAHSDVHTCQFSRYFENKPGVVRPLNFRIQGYSVSLPVPLRDISVLNHREKVAPWEEVPVVSDWSLKIYSTRVVSVQVLKQ